MSRQLRNLIQGRQLALVIEVQPLANPRCGEQICTRSGRAIVTHTEAIGQERLIWADYGSVIAQPHVSEGLLTPEQVSISPPEQRPRRHSPKGEASGWIEERLGNRKRKTPSLSYYYRWQDELGRHSRYIPTGKLWRVQQMVEVEGRLIGEVLEVLGG